MRLHPQLTEDEAYTQLRANAVALYGEEGAQKLEPSLRSLAEAIAAISAYPLPITVPPLFP